MPKKCKKKLIVCFRGIEDSKEIFKPGREKAPEAFALSAKGLQQME